MTLVFVGSNPAIPAIFYKYNTNRDPLAQQAEHLTFNQGVRRSNRRWITNMERYRSGHNEAVLKTVWVKARVGSNPTLSAKIPQPDFFDRREKKLIVGHLQ